MSRSSVSSSDRFPYATVATGIGLVALGYVGYRTFRGRTGFFKPLSSTSSPAPSAPSSTFGTAHNRKTEHKVASYGGGGENLFKTGSNYGAYRPSYPDRLYERIEKYAKLSRTRTAELAVDVACGTGQATLGLRKYYDNVIGVEASEGQRTASVRAEGVVYLPGRAEAIPLADNIADIVTVAQAAHWFDLPKFFNEANRVLKPGGTAAIWCYGLVYLDNERAQRHVYGLYEGTLGTYWDQRRLLIDQLYETIHFPSPPWTRLERETKRMNLWEGKTMTVKQFILYLGTWSAYNTYRAKHPDLVDPLIALEHDLLVAYGGKNAEETILHCEFDVTLLLAQKTAAAGGNAAAFAPATASP